MLEGGIIAKLLEEKWKTFAMVLLRIDLQPWHIFCNFQGMFYKKMLILLLHLLTMSMAIYTRPPFKDGLMNGLKDGEDAPEMTDFDLMRYILVLIFFYEVSIWR